MKQFSSIVKIAAIGIFSISCTSVQKLERQPSSELTGSVQYIGDTISTEAFTMAKAFRIEVENSAELQNLLDLNKVNSDIASIESKIHDEQSQLNQLNSFKQLHATYSDYPENLKSGLARHKIQETLKVHLQTHNPGKELENLQALYLESSAFLCDSFQISKEGFELANSQNNQTYQVFFGYSLHRSLTKPYVKDNCGRETLSELSRSSRSKRSYLLNTFKELLPQLPNTRKAFVYNYIAENDLNASIYTTLEYYKRAHNIHTRQGNKSLAATTEQNFLNAVEDALFNLERQIRYAKENASASEEIQTVQAQIARNTIVLEQMCKDVDISRQSPTFDTDIQSACRVFTIEKEDAEERERRFQSADLIQLQAEELLVKQALADFYK